MAQSTKSETTVTATKADLDYGEGHSDGVRWERERCAQVVEKECIYMIGKIQAAAIARKLRNG